MLSFASAAANKVAAGLAWSPETGLVAYPADANVCIMATHYHHDDPATTPAQPPNNNTSNNSNNNNSKFKEQDRVVAVLTAHNARVNTVKWLDARTLVSASADKTARVWRLSPDGSNAPSEWDWRAEWPSTHCPWISVATLEGHTASVTALATLTVPQTPVALLPTTTTTTTITTTTKEGASAATVLARWIATASGDGTVRIWLCTDEHVAASATWTCVQTIAFGVRYMESVTLACLPNSPVPILATGGVDRKVHIFTYDTADTRQFALRWSLAGHEDWIRAVAFAHAPVPLSELTSPSPVAAQDGNESAGSSGSSGTAADTPCLLLASAAQDSMVRLWRVECSATNNSQATAAVLDALLTGHDLPVYSIEWEPAVQVGTDPVVVRQPLSLLTASMDRTLMKWQPDPESAVWINTTRVGEFSGAGLGFYGGIVGPRGTAILAQGFQGALHPWTKQPQPGAASSNDADAGGTLPYEAWVAQASVSGHFGPAEDLDFDPTGELLFSTSADMTTRIFASWERHLPGAPDLLLSWHEIARPQIHGYSMNAVATVGSFRFASAGDEKVVRVFDATGHFRETLQALLPAVPAVDASAAFDTASALVGATQERVRLAQQARRGVLLADRTWQIATASGPTVDTLSQRGRALGASVPALGLTNRAVFEDDLSGGVAKAAAGDDTAAGESSGRVATAGDDEESAFTAQEAPPGFAFRYEKIAGPPPEEHLTQNTLWPEAHKLYGHGNEVFALACTHAAVSADPTAPAEPASSLGVSSKGRLLASSCKATRADTAVIRVSELDTYRDIALLEAHTLTVTQLAFSHNDQFLLSVSRDRTWTLFSRIGHTFSLVAKTPAHERIIWACSFSHDDRFFATASRDMTIKIWALEAPGTCVATIDHFRESVTAIDFAPAPYEGGYLLAVGLDSGTLGLLQIKAAAGSSSQMTVTSAKTLDKSVCPSSTIRRIRFRPFPVVDSIISSARPRLQFATASTDTSVRLYDVPL
ncbi:statip1 [Capsaspora owczarzaki ATCC 30864]|uniref:Elongator complex protein 2 n=1 Tax=Capsaspora owczarzaki (strain ATCC 30864) TaxID=595528 RepID=A0A0D2WI26_CAPO3|nr:statip1 [Capsaspora owczarzaki ATCC 30864]KJE89425.1 statip1 [Capsaspora owczarzaki ATCC 30864]|eukprot:XP_004365765.2 statip1 [Capsaspora owczarzaki ATCC 30864]